MIRAFTGPSRLGQRQARFVWETVRSLVPADEVRTGGAYGADTEAAIASYAHLPDARHVIYLPAATYNEEVRHIPGVEFVLCDVGPTAAVSYRLRNQAMLEGVDELVAFVTAPTFYRSGEWMTINIARKFSEHVNVDKRVLP